MPLVSIKQLYMLTFTWYAEITTRNLRRDKEDQEAHQDPLNRLSQLEKTVPTENFLLWRQRQCRQMKDSTTFPSHYEWLVSLPLDYALIFEAVEFV